MSEGTSWPPAWPYPPTTAPLRTERAMVATTDRYASEVGLSVLKGGGNAVDAAVAVSFALAVVNPEAGNVGGGGYLVLRMADGRVAAQDHRSVAPAGATRDMFVEPTGEVGEGSVIGPLSVAVPGTVRGLWDAHREYGSHDWEDLLEPAIHLARRFIVGERFLQSFTEDVVEGLRRFPESARVFLPTGSPPSKGDRFSQPDLARTLERIRDGGPNGFYGGETAERIEAFMRASGGLVTRRDLAEYASIWREPVRARYRRHTVLSMPPSSSGGVTLAETLHMLEGFPVGEIAWHSPEHVHLLAEVWRRAYADRNRYLADPDFVKMPLETLTSREYAAWRARDIDLDAATPSAAIQAGVSGFLTEGKHTTHVSIVDPQRNAVALTTTINSWYGSKVVVPGTGIVLNNDMDDFTAKVGAPNQFGLVQGEANSIAPRKRMLSAMAPTLVLDAEDRLALVVGTPGGSSIISTVCQVISNLLDHGMDVAQAVVAPRVHHQHLPDHVQYEADGLSAETLAGLQARGHRLHERDERAGDVEAIRVLPDGTLEGMADPRRGGTALGF